MWKLSVYFIAGDVSDFRIVLFSFHVRASGDSLSFQLVIFEFFFFLFLIIHKQNQSINFNSHQLILSNSQIGDLSYFNQFSSEQLLM